MNFKSSINIFHLILAFVIVIQIGSLSTELSRSNFAKLVSYSGEYSKSFGRYFFHSQTMKKEIKLIRLKYDQIKTDYTDSKEWQELIKADQADRAFFELSSKIINVLISTIGVLFFLYYRKKESNFSYKQLLSLLFGMFFMRDVVINVFDLLSRSMLCVDAAIWKHFDLPIFQSTRIYTIIGITSLLILLYLTPSNVRFKLIFSGIVGSILGMTIWLFLLGPLLLS